LLELLLPDCIIESSLNYLFGLEFLGVLFGIGLMVLSDLTVHNGLGKLGLINFIVPVFSVTDDIHNKVFAVLGPVLDS